MPEPQIALKVAFLQPANDNPFFETNVASWSPSGSTFTRSTIQAYQGVASGLLTPDGVTAGPAVGCELVPVLPAATYRAQAWVRCAVTRTVQIGFNWYNSVPGFLSDSVTSVAVTANTWTQLEFTTDSPGTAAFGQTKVVLPGATPNTHLTHIDAAMLLPPWTDLAGRLLYGDGGGPLTIDIGRQTELQDVEPTRIAATLKNGDGWLNPRNPSSPYYGTWEQGREVRVTEAVDGEEIDLATGFLEIPDVQVNSPNLDQPCAISAVDRLGRLDGAPPFAGTLAEHVRAYGGKLVLHFPLDDTYPHMSSDTVSTLTRVVVGFDTSVAAEPADLVEANGLAGPPGDDRSYIKFAPIVSGSVYLARARLETPVSVAVAATDTLAVSVWLHPTHAEDSTTLRSSVIQLLAGSGAGLSITSDNTDGLEIRWNDTVATTLNAGRQLEREVWRLVTARINFATLAMDLWCGSSTVVSGTAAVAPSALTLTRLAINSLWEGGVGQLQVRVGPSATTMTRAMHLEQYGHGYRGLHRQTVAERVGSLAAFAGVPAAELDLPAEASTPMQVAKLAGVTPSSAMQDAATTGQDILMTTPQGRITLVPRARRYNQAVAMSIPFGWIMRGGIRYRPDKPATDAVASRVDGGTARRASEPLRARYGVLARTVTLDTDVDADPANWTSWTLAAFGEPRTRCPLLRINLLKRTTTDRKALLRLRVGDRIQLTDMPPGSPEDVPHLIVQGFRHIIGPHRRRLIEFNTSPLLGLAPGVPPACPVVGDLVSNTAIIAY